MDHEPSRALRALAVTVVRRAGFVLAAWVALAGVLNLAVPQLEEVVARDSTPFVPLDSPSSEALRLMDEEFGDGGSQSYLVVVGQRAGGLERQDRRWLRTLVPVLDEQPEVSFVQDVRDRQLRRALTSEDGEAVYLQVGIPGYTGAPSAIQQVEAVRHTAVETAPEGLTVLVTGPTATIADMAVEAESSILVITVVTVGLIFVLLMLIYRRLSVALVILGSVGLSLACARGVTAWLGLEGVFDVSTFTGSFLTAIVLGAGVDYAIFLVSRYHEQRHLGVEPRAAATYAASRVSAVIIGSALTVVLANAAMLLADLGVYTTTGPAIAVSVLVTLGVAVTLLPALLGMLGTRGLVEPRPRRSTGRGWSRMASLAVHRPGRAATAALLPLLLLACFFPFYEPSFDERRVQPEDTESNRGYELLAEHYPVNEVLPDYVLVRSDRDLRNARDLAVLEQAARSAGRVPGVVSVRAVTRPLGEPIDQARVSYQAGVVGDELASARDELGAGQSDAQRLASGAQDLDAGAAQLDSGAAQLAAGADQAVAGAARLVDSVAALEEGVEALAAGAGEASAGSDELVAGARALAAGLDTAADQTQTAVEGLGMALDALESSVPCSLDPVCRQARDGVRQVYEGERDELLPGLRQAAAAADRIASGSTDLRAGLRDLTAGLDQASDGADRLAAGQRTFADRLGELEDGTDELAASTGTLSDGTGQVASGTGELVGSVDELEDGLTTAARFLRNRAEVADTPAMGGFYLPPAQLRHERLAAASSLFLSQDGRTARFAVLGDTDAFGPEAATRSAEVHDAVERGLSGTRLEDTEVMSAGIAAVNADLTRAEDRDFTMIAIVAMVTVFVILLVLLRSVVAAAVLLATVVLSYASAVGLGVLVWQIGLDEPLEWSVPSLAFILLVAVGADYNLLLAKRMHEEAPDGAREGIARAAVATGGVITAAGIIFAASMFALMAASVTTLVQVGFVIGVGLLIDTFVVRTLLVPSIASVLGRRLWWPQQVAR